MADNDGTGYDATDKKCSEEILVLQKKVDELYKLIKIEADNTNHLISISKGREILLKIEIISNTLLSLQKLYDFSYKEIFNILHKIYKFMIPILILVGFVALSRLLDVIVMLKNNFPVIAY